ncbi:MAG TPA: DUF4097 family beta strand repeat-containing protein [Pyrinomonadaceae bacterium]|jgi:hypothetical protein
MKSKALRLSLFASFIVLAPALTAAAQDFHKTYPLTAGGTVSAVNVSGDLKVTGYDGEVVVVNGYKEGRDRDQLEVEDLSGGNSVSVRARYPSCSNCSVNASVRFEIQVPRNLSLNFDKLQTASGNIQVTNVTGRVRASTASGRVTLQNVNGSVNASTASGEMRVKDVSGTVKASTASGDVDVELARVEGSESLTFSTASGSIRAKVPSSLDAEVDISTASGEISTDFPLEVRKSEYGPQRRARGRLGSGSRTLRLSSASGDISLTRL